MKNTAAIIPVSLINCQNNSWKSELKNAISSSHVLLKYLGIDIKTQSVSKIAESDFSVRVPLSFAAKMEKNNLHDPLLIQVLATNAELIKLDGFSRDPLLEQDNSLPGLIHKYNGRALLMLTGACAVNCRYCFRRHFPYQDQTISDKNFSKILAHLQQDQSISEIILSGGDPLIISDQKLREIVNKISDITHIKRLRIHSRLPIVIPARITEQFIQAMQNTRLKTSLVIHVNHPNELDDEIGARLKKLSTTGTILLNQSVLLKNVNDNHKVLSKLSERLFDYGVIPYYLHMLDTVEGSAHFQVKKVNAIKLFKQLQNELPGYLVPRLVAEEANHSAKTLVY